MGGQTLVPASIGYKFFSFSDFSFYFSLTYWERSSLIVIAKMGVLVEIEYIKLLKCMSKTRVNVSLEL